MDEEISRNLTGVEEKDIPGQQFLADEWEYVRLTQGVDMGRQQAGCVVGCGGEAAKQNEQQERNSGVQDSRCQREKPLNATLWIWMSSHCLWKVMEDVLILLCQDYGIIYTIEG